jgi:hypothetical protein
VKQQRNGIKFCFILGQIETETHKMLKEAFDDDIRGLIQAYEMFKRSLKEWMLAAVGGRSG